MIANRRHRRTWLHPLHLAAHELAGHPRAIPAKSWITAEVDADGAVNKATLELPPGFPADEKDKQRLVSIASQKLGIEAAEPTWRLAGPTPLLTLRHSPPPPGHVTMAYLLPELASCKDDELLIGIGKNDEVIKASLGTDSPHIAISMGTGAGKSNLAGWILLQMLLRDGIGLVLDAKRRLSYPWILKDGERRVVQLPDVAYAWTTAQMHEAMAWLSGELDRRGDVAFAAMDTRGRVHANVGNRLFILAEELNLAVPRLRAYWQENRDPEIDPSKSPAFTGLGEVRVRRPAGPQAPDPRRPDADRRGHRLAGLQRQGELRNQAAGQVRAEGLADDGRGHPDAAAAGVDRPRPARDRGAGARGADARTGPGRGAPAGARREPGAAAARHAVPPRGCNCFSGASP